MGKYVGYVILILIILLAVEYFGIVDIPYFDIPDYFSGKEDMMDKTCLLYTSDAADDN